MTAVVFGSALGQWPLGRLSDRTDRRIVLGAVASFGVVIGVSFWLMAPELSNVGIITLAALWGALAFPIYPLAAAHANDRAEAGRYVMVSAGLLMMFGVGAIIGPFIASTMMAFGNPGNLFLFTSIVHLFLAVYVVARRSIRPQAAMSDHKPFSDALASTQTASQIFEDELERVEESG